MYPRFSETFILDEVLELERQGLDLHIFSLKKPDDGRFHADLSRVRARVTYVPESFREARHEFLVAHREVFGWDRVRYVRALWEVLRRRRRGALKRFWQAGYIAPRIRGLAIAHVHAHFASGATAVALWLHQLTGIPYSFTAHAKDIYADSVEPKVLQRKLARARFAVTVSDYNVNYLAALRGPTDGADLSGPGRLVRIYNGLDLRQFSPRDTVPDSPPLVLGVGRLVEKKGFADLIRACQVLRTVGCQFRCLIVGKGPLEPALRAMIHELGLTDRVELGGAMPREALLELYPRASVVVAPCVVGRDGNRDGLPTVLIEAMALGVPVVATEVTGIPELVQDGRTGLLVPQGDIEALARAIGRLLEDCVTARTLVAAGRARVEQDFDLRANVAQLRALFEEATAA
jgi:colanic acid/amylovoran biosynthesis glycosyltransferase